MLNTIIGAAVAVLVVAVILGVIRTFLAGQDTTNWTANEVNITWVLPTVMLIIVLVGMFLLLQRRGRT